MMIYPIIQVFPIQVVILIGDKDPEKFYNYRCLESQHFYSTPYHPSLFDFTFKELPPYSPEPYTYIHKATICGREMNLTNMYISYHVANQLQDYLIEYIETTFRIQMRKNVLGQLITMFEPSNTIKLQMIVKDEYFYWTIFTLLTHYEELRRRGLARFKFSYLLGERKINQFSETFPDRPRNAEESFETYILAGKQYRREVLHSPIIVMYLTVTTIEPLIRFLQSLFPVPISTGEVPRFNYRIDDNLFFSVEGHNQYKFDKPGVPPEEYQKMVSDPKYAEYNEFSRYISGHDVLYGSHPNNIRSYHHLFQTQTSFRNVYESVGLLEDYQNMWGKLGLPPILDVAGGNFLKHKQKTKRISGTKRKYARKQVSRNKLRK